MKKNDSKKSNESILDLEKRLLNSIENDEDGVENLMNLLCTRFPNEWQPLTKEELKKYKDIQAQLINKKL